MRMSGSDVDIPFHPGQPACDYCDEGVTLIDGWHLIEDPEEFEGGIARIPCPRYPHAGS